MPFSVVEILKAKKNLEGVIYRTPITHSKRLSEITGADVYIKWENLQKTRSFKLRGAYNKIYSLTQEERRNAVITASTGNHALAVAFVAKMTGIMATVVVPENTPKTKVERSRTLEAEVRVKGSNYDESVIYCKKTVIESGATYISAFDDYEVIAGQGTIGYEILEELPETDTIIVPVGGGGLISGIALWIKTITPNIRVIGAQSTSAYTMYECYKAKKIVVRPYTTHIS